MRTEKTTSARSISAKIITEVKHFEEDYGIANSITAVEQVTLNLANMIVYEKHEHVRVRLMEDITRLTRFYNLLIKLLPHTCKIEKD